MIGHLPPSLLSTSFFSRVKALLCRTSHEQLCKLDRGIWTRWDHPGVAPVCTRGDVGQHGMVEDAADLSREEEEEEVLAFRVCRDRVATLLEPDILRCLHSDSDVIQAEAVRYRGTVQGVIVTVPASSQLLVRYVTAVQFLGHDEAAAGMVETLDMRRR